MQILKLHTYTAHEIYILLVIHKGVVDSNYMLRYVLGIYMYMISINNIPDNDNYSLVVLILHVCLTCSKTAFSKHLDMVTSNM